MTTKVRRHETFESWKATTGAMLVTIAMAVGGCTAPPAMTPLLRQAQKAMAAETDLLATDLAREQRSIAQQQRSLAAAFEADLKEKPQITADWVLEAMDGYVAARETLVRHELAVKEEMDQRSENLRAATAAQERAINLLERQDDLIAQTSGLDIWRLQFRLPLQPVKP